METQTKRLYEQVQRELLKEGRKKGLAERFEILREFIESVDLARLRRQSEKYFLEGKRVKFIFSLEKGKPE